MTKEKPPSSKNDRRSSDRIADGVRSGQGSKSALSRLKMLERRYGPVFRITRSAEPDDRKPGLPGTADKDTD